MWEPSLCSVLVLKQCDATGTPLPGKPLASTAALNQCHLQFPYYVRLTVRTSLAKVFEELHRLHEAEARGRGTIVAECEEIICFLTSASAIVTLDYERRTRWQQFEVTQRDKIYATFAADLSLHAFHRIEQCEQEERDGLDATWEQDLLEHHALAFERLTLAAVESFVRCEHAARSDSEHANLARQFHSGRELAQCIGSGRVAVACAQASGAALEEEAHSMMLALLHQSMLSVGALQQMVQQHV